MPTTSNFGWTTPADTDLVKDGAAAIRTLGNGIDASLVDLKGGTTGQILSKASNADLDYTWVNSNPGDITEVNAGVGISGGGTSGAVTITNSMATAIDAKGDLVAGTGADAFARLAVGANNTVLTADSTTATGLRWATPATGGGYTSIASGSLSGSATNITSISQSYTDLYLVLKDVSTSAIAEVSFRFNNDSTSLRHIRQGDSYKVGGSANAVVDANNRVNWTYNQVATADNDNQYILRVNNYSVAQKHTGIAQCLAIENGGANDVTSCWIYYTDTAAITEVNIITSQSFTGGTYILYGVK